MCTAYRWHTGSVQLRTAMILLCCAGLASCAQPAAAPPRYVEPREYERVESTQYGEVGPVPSHQYGEAPQYSESAWPSEPAQYGEPAAAAAAAAVQASAYQDKPSHVAAVKASGVVYHQAGPAHSSSMARQPAVSKAAPQASAGFDVDAWLAELNIGTAPQKPISTAGKGTGSASNVGSNPGDRGSAQHANQSRGAGAPASNSFQNGISSKPRYTPPHLRSESGAPQGVAPYPGSDQQAPPCRAPPGFAARMS